MDPVSAIGVSAAILQFTEFGWKFVRTAWAIHDTVRGETFQDDKTEDLVGRMEGLLSDLRQKAQATNATSNEQTERIVALAAHCEKLGQSMLQILKKTKTTTGSFRDCLRAAGRTVFSRSTIVQLQRQLSHCHDQLSLCLLVEMKYAAHPLPSRSWDDY
jgi:hypothetical protein